MNVFSSSCAVPLALAVLFTGLQTLSLHPKLVEKVAVALPSHLLMFTQEFCDDGTCLFITEFSYRTFFVSQETLSEAKLRNTEMRRLERALDDESPPLEAIHLYYNKPVPQPDDCKGCSVRDRLREVIAACGMPANITLSSPAAGPESLVMRSAAQQVTFVSAARMR